MRADQGVLGDVIDALGLLTRLPVPARRKPAARAVWAYPIVGLLVGFVGGAIDWLCLKLGIASSLAAIWAVAGQLLLTGALHEDGLADTADGFGAGGDRARKLAIMRDSRIGAFGAMALILMFAVRVAAIDAQGGWPTTGLLMAAGASGRAALVLLLSTLRPARSDGMAAALHAPPLLALVVALGVAILADLALGLRTVIAAACACWAVAAIARRQIGGYTGDVLGACEQIVEAAVLSAAVG